jgi:RES domain-containing protein
LEYQTAVEEGFVYYRYYGFPLENALPRVLTSIRVRLQRVLDLTDQRIRRTLAVSRADLLEEDWRAANAARQEARTQALGRLAWADRWGDDPQHQWEGLLAPSAAHPGGVNLILFPANLLPPDSYILPINRDQLPPPPGS